MEHPVTLVHELILPCAVLYMCALDRRCLLRHSNASSNASHPLSHSPSRLHALPVPTTTATYVRRQATEAILLEERKWVVQELFDYASSPAYVKAKSVDNNGERGPDQLFDTIKNSSDERVQRAWRSSCGPDLKKIETALGSPRAQIPSIFVAKWNDALVSVFGESYKFKSRTQGTGCDIKSMHVFKLRIKGAH